MCVNSALLNVHVTSQHLIVTNGTTPIGRGPSLAHNLGVSHGEPSSN